METNDLIRMVAADARRPGPSLPLVWWGAVGLAIVVAALVFAALLGPRSDISAAAETPRFLVKFVISLALAASAFGLVRKLSLPGETWYQSAAYLATGPTLIAVAVVVELSVLPPDIWSTRLIGTNSMACLTYIPLIGAGPLAIFLLVLRYGAPTNPTGSGAVAGVLAGGIAAAFYATHCTDDSPLFVATWYTIAITGLVLVGAAAANRFARW